MRIQFGNRIYRCDAVSRIGGFNSTYMGASTPNGFYHIKFKKPEEANKAYQQLLEKGYYNATNNEYSNHLK